MDSLNDIWDEVLRLLSEELSQTTINTWFNECCPLELSLGTLTVYTPSEFKKTIISERYSERLKKILKNLFSDDIDVVITDKKFEKKAKKSILPDTEDYSFENFIVGPSNKFAHAAAEAVAKNGIKYNPLLIYGNSGLGKTHLLLAMLSEIRERAPEKSIILIKGEQFTNELIQSIRDGTQGQFRERYRNTDFLLMDDIQFIAGKPATQEEFFHTFNSIYETGGQIILTSDRPPKDMPALNDRIRTRFEGGLLADIEPPDFETRAAIVRNKAARYDLSLPDEYAEYIAKNITANIRQLEGVLKKLAAYKAILKTGLDMGAVTRAVSEVTVPGEYVPQPQIIIHEAAVYFNIRDEDLTGNDQSRKYSRPRQLAMYLIRELTGLPFEDIGKIFGRHHATVIASVNNIENLKKKDIRIANAVRDIESNLDEERDGSPH